MKTLIRRATITEPGKDDTIRPVQKMTYFQRVTEAEIVFPYGVHANLPEDALMVLIPILDQTSNFIAFGGLPNERIPVEPGEVVFFHPSTKAKVHFKANGDIDIDSLSENININCSSANVTADTEVNVTTPTVNITGDVNINGNLDVTGVTTLSDTVTSNGVDISDTHKHTGSPTAGTGPISDTGNPV